MKWRLLFRMLCHGIPERCLELFGVPMPLCARCTGIYVGLFAGVALALALPWMEERLVRLAMFAAAVPMTVDGLTQLSGLRESTNPLRLATGFAAAVAFGLWAVTMVEKADRPAVSLTGP
jgi:uncharacterized membrane protein